MTDCAWAAVTTDTTRVEPCTLNSVNMVASEYRHQGKGMSCQHQRCKRFQFAKALHGSTRTCQLSSSSPTRSLHSLIPLTPVIQATFIGGQGAAGSHGMSNSLQQHSRTSVRTPAHTNEYGCITSLVASRAQPARMPTLTPTLTPSYTNIHPQLIVRPHGRLR